MFVYVQNRNGKPLMPTKRCGFVRRLLRDGKAKVVCQIPFTIRLNYETTDYVQPITLGIDSGTKHVGLSATTSKHEVFSAVVELRDDIVGLLSDRSGLRSSRRGRLRHRKKRVKNRSNGRQKGSIPPSVRQKLISYNNILNRIDNIIPVKLVRIEINPFDIHRMKNRSVGGRRYSKGEMYGFNNVKDYILFRDKGVCQICKGESGCKRLNIHHIESRRVGGNSPSNLILLCEDCHKKFHSGSISAKFIRGRRLRDASLMGILNVYLTRDISLRYKSFETVFGFDTFDKRVDYGIEKSHNSDAFLISNNLNSIRLDYWYKIRLSRRHNRQIHKPKPKKGASRSLNRLDFEVFGYRMFDRVLYNNNIYFITGRRKSGIFVIKDIDFKVKKEPSFRSLTLKRISGPMISLIR